MQKKVMILGANNFMLPLIKTAKKKGYYTIVVSPVSSEPGFELADEKVYVDLRDKEAVLNKARELNIDGITTDQAGNSSKDSSICCVKVGITRYW